MPNKAQTQECIISAVQSTGGPTVLWFCWFFFSLRKFKFACVRAMPHEWYEAVVARGLLAACAPGTAG